MSEKEEIIDAIKKGSFPLEIECTSTLWKKGWYTNNQVNYSDPQTQKLRTIDIQALFVEVVSIDFVPFTVKLKLAIECKKSKKPWVFYTVDSRRLTSTERFIENYAKSLVSYSLNSKSLKKKHIDFETHFSQNAFRGLIPTEPFNHGSNANISEASNQCVKAATDIFVTERAIDSKLDHKISEALIVYPVIVLEGKLFAASIEKSGEPSIEEKEWIIYDYAMTFETKRLPTTRILVDIVTKNYFEKYLSDLEEECKSARLSEK